jgi:regulatory protein YycI of two-component signal transduction system YycFG
MDTKYIFLIELVLFNGVVLAWAFYEFWSVRKRKDETDSSSPPRDPGHPEG